MNKKLTFLLIIFFSLILVGCQRHIIRHGGYGYHGKPYGHSGPIYRHSGDRHYRPSQYYHRSQNMNEKNDEQYSKNKKSSGWRTTMLYNL